MGARYEVHLYGNTGGYITTLTKRFTKLTWETHVGDLGHFDLTLSDRMSPVDTSVFQKNGRLSIWRKAGPFDPARLLMVGFIRDKRFWTDERGITRYMFSGPDQNDLLNIRTCFPMHPYTAGFWRTGLLGYADTVIRELAEDNLGAGSSNSSLRDLVTSNTAGLTIAIESSATATSCATAGKMDVEYGGKTLLQLFQGIHLSSKTFLQPDAGATAAVRVWFNMCPDTDTTVTLRVRPTRWGQNHRRDSGNAVNIGTSFSNLRLPRYREVSSFEVNAGLALYYAGSNSYADSSWALDETRIGEAPLNRREAAATASEGELGPVANELINEGEPIKEFKGFISDTAGCRFGVHWEQGDELPIDYLDQQYDVMVTGVRGEYQSGRERIEPIMEVQD